MTSTRHLVAAMVGVALLLGGAACQSSKPEQGSSTVTTNDAEMPDLPNDEIAAKAVVRKMVMDAAVVLLKASGLKYTGAQFDVPSSYDDDTQNGNLSIYFDKCTDADVQAMTAAVWAHGWKQGGISHGINVHKGPLRFQGGKSIDGCSFEITTVNISQHLLITDDITRVPELAAFKARP